MAPLQLLLCGAKHGADYSFTLGYFRFAPTEFGVEVGTERRVIEYRASPTLSKFHQSNAFVRGLMGPVGSGKSTACAIELFRRAQEQAPGPDGVRRTKWVVVRNSYRELLDTTVPTWLEWFPEGDYGPFSRTDMAHRIRVGSLHTEMLFRALDRPDDISKLLSLEVTGAWVNEAREVPRAVIDMIPTRFRFPRKEKVQGERHGPTWSGMIMDTNPPDMDSWWHRLFEEDRPDGWEVFKQPSAVAKDAENIGNLPDRYYERFMAGKHEDWIKIYVHGEYGFVADGKPVYPEFRSGIHVASKELAPIPGLPIYVGIDFGLTPAAMIGQRDSEGRWRWLSELVATDMGAVRFGEQLKRVLHSQYAGYKVEAHGDPAGDGRSQVDERTAYDALAAAGVPATPAPTNDFVVRREAVARALGRLIDGEPGLLISPECKVAIKGMAGGYRYKRVQVSGDERYHDKPDKNQYSHVCEAGQYMMVGAGEEIALNAPEDWGRKLSYEDSYIV